ncbi:MAG: MFS transporter [Dehalobacter sp.]|nr:MFS transporter [Dehalobacter sp.]
MSEPNRSYKWVVLLLMCLTMIAFNSSQISIAPNVGLILKDIPMNNTQVGFAMSAATLCGIVFAYFISLLANKVNRKTLVLIALLLIGAGVALTGTATDFWTIVIGRIIAGLGSTTLIIVTPLFVTGYFDEKNMGMAMALFTAAQPLGMIFGLNVFGRVGAAVGWRNTMFMIACLEIAVFLLCLLFLRLPKANAEVSAASHSLKDTPKSINMWLLAVIYAVFTLSVSAYVNFGPTYFGMNGTPPAQIGLFASLIMIIPLVLSPFFGAALDKGLKNYKRPILIFGAVLMAASYCAIGFHFMNTFFIWAVLLGLGFTVVAPVCYSAMPEMVSEKNLSIGMGLLIISFDVGGSFGAILFGTVLDASHGVFSVAFSVVSVLLLVLIPLILVLKLRENSLNKSEQRSLSS